MKKTSLPYAHALKRLLEVTSSPRLGLERMQRLLFLLKDPQHDFTSIHVAGTNGKGSTLLFCESLLIAAKQKVGRTTSPHLTCARERITLNGVFISEDLFCDFEAKIQCAASKMSENPPTFFERMTALSFLAFSHWQVDVALIEVGLGGRLDATNVIQPALCGISRIALDHTQWLGDNVEQIAIEKAGIFKENSPAFSSEQKPAVLLTLESQAKNKKIQFRTAQPLHDEVKLGLKGEHQKENAALALSLVRSFLQSKNQFLPLSLEKKALENTSWAGRFELFLGGRIILDGAHNPNAARALSKTYALKMPPNTPSKGSAKKENKLNLLLGSTEGHGPADFIKALLDEEFQPHKIWVTKARAPRSLSAHKVATAISPYFQGPIQEVEIEQIKKELLTSSQNWLVTGSLYLVGEVRAALTDMPFDDSLPFF